jgi:hypothetical protein
MKTNHIYLIALGVGVVAGAFYFGTTSNPLLTNATASSVFSNFYSLGAQI